MSSEMEQKFLENLFTKPELLTRALTHKSYANENRSGLEHNEKLEFLGDAVLDLVIGEYLFEFFPEDSEGGLSKKRASVVNEEVLSEIAQTLSLEQLLRLGKGEAQTGGAQKPRLLASAFEAVLGALFLDQGFEKTKAFIRERFQGKMSQLSVEVDYEKDYKTRLQEVVQKKLKATPTYTLLSEEGPPHDRYFQVSVNVLNETLGKGMGKSKKSAEQNAAEQALVGLKETV